MIQVIGKMFYAAQKFISIQRSNLNIEVLILFLNGLIHGKYFRKLLDTVRTLPNLTCLLIQPWIHILRGRINERLPCNCTV